MVEHARTTATIVCTDVAARSLTLAQVALVRRHRGVVVDAADPRGLVLVFDSAGDALDGAVAVQRADWPGADCGPPRLGVAAGDVVWEDGRCTGGPLLVAGRLRDLAMPGRILATATVAALAGAHHNGTTLVAATEIAWRSVPPPVERLSQREIEVIRLVATGCSNRQIGTRLFISENTAANHVRSILQKTACANRAEAVAYAARRHLLDDRV